MASGQPFDLEAELAQPFLREGDLPALERILFAPADQERELAAIRLVETAEVESIALSLVVGRKARRAAR